MSAKTSIAKSLKALPLQVAHHSPGNLVIAELFQCSSLPTDLCEIQDCMLKATEMMGAHVVKPVFHKFNPYGLSGVIIIKESHFAIHTWPELGYAAVDLFSCGKINYAPGFKFLAESFGAAKIKTSVILRGK